MDQSIQRLLNDKLYDKRKQGALELEKIVREAVFRGEHEKIQRIVEQLCHDYAYAVHQPHARNGGLIGLAAASIALGSEGVAPYLKEIVPPVLACFSDQDARVRYYACESMYNIAKVAKGEILLFFNDIFDALAKLASDSELSVKNGAELLDRLVKDIVAESAASYVSVLQISEKEDPNDLDETELPTAFSLAKFIPLLKERIHVIGPYTRNFLVSWLTLLDTIPDLELVTYLPEFLEGLIKFLGGPNKDVNVATQGLLDRFLSEIKRITILKKGIEESRKGQESRRRSATSDNGSLSTKTETIDEPGDKDDIAVDDSASGSLFEDEVVQADGDWIPGQDVQIDYTKILDILVSFVDTSYDEEMQLTALRWIDTFFEISPEDILPFVPRLLTQVLPAMSSGSDQVRQAANRVNKSLLEYIYSLSDDAADEPLQSSSKVPSTAPSKESVDRKPSEISSVDTRKSTAETSRAATPRSSVVSTPVPPVDLDYAAAVNSLTLQFLNENEATRVAALSWLIMLHRKAPRKVVAFNDGTFPALLKTLSDPAEAVVTKDLQLLSQISRNSEDSYFASFMVNLLQLFSTDRHLLEVRGNLIIRQLCLNLSPERIYRTLADCLEKEEDIEFASIMVQNLNNNLITAPELSDMRKRLRNLDSKEGQMFFVALFRSWCHNAVSTFSLCLLAQAYEQAYNLLQIFAELEMTVNMLIQIDKLVQLLESPVFTYLRLQLLEPEKYPYLYKCLYGVLMLLPQSSAFAALKNRLNSVSNIGYLHGPPRSAAQTGPPQYDRPSGSRLKPRDENSIRWVELLDKFKFVQERARRAQASQRQSLDANDSLHNPSLTAALSAATIDRTKDRSGIPDLPRNIAGGSGAMGPVVGGAGLGVAGNGGGSRGAGEPKISSSSSLLGSGHKHKSSLPNLGRLGIGSRKSKK
ncbi:Protein VAC14 [Penicillium citrinum]|uniref:Protein VAC14 n=1 Tax=Penicillium citrinum TaxID=5077 RepID=A0A9W9NQK7_PENCI|nr:Protein VAC14 [Penicillium citrinum]KAJ5224352.1 Protein VAC14 [Penicillium citrinum]